MSTAKKKPNKNSRQAKSKGLVPKVAIIGSALAISSAASSVAIISSNQATPPIDNAIVRITTDNDTFASDVLQKLKIKQAVSKDGYSRDEFFEGWTTLEGCNLRQRIIRREFGDDFKLSKNGCTVVSGGFTEPYTGEYRSFATIDEISNGVQIDHIVALSDAWQKGAQALSKEARRQIATDPLNLLAVDATSNRQKSDSDASEWLPPNTKFHCEYVARQISVKYKYGLWVTQPEHDAMAGVLETCPKKKITTSAISGK